MYAFRSEITVKPESFPLSLSSVSDTCCSSDVQRRKVQTAAHAALRSVLSRWISVPCLGANWLYQDCSRLSPQPSPPSFDSYQFEEVHKKFPLFPRPGQKEHGWYHTPPAGGIKLPLLSSVDSFSCFE